MFYVVDFPTAILGIQDSESLRLITVHFDNIGSEISQPEPDSEPELSLKTKQSSSTYVNAIQMIQIQMSLASKSNMNTRIYSLVLGT